MWTSKEQDVNKLWSSCEQVMYKWWTNCYEVVKSHEKIGPVTIDILLTACVVRDGSNGSYLDQNGLYLAQDDKCGAFKVSILILMLL